MKYWQVVATDMAGTVWVYAPGVKTWHTLYDPYLCCSCQNFSFSKCGYTRKYDAEKMKQKMMEQKKGGWYPTSVEVIETYKAENLRQQLLLKV